MHVIALFVGDLGGEQAILVVIGMDGGVTDTLLILGVLLFGESIAPFVIGGFGAQG